MSHGVKREIRASAVAGIAGVGAVIDVGQESFIIPGINDWPPSELREVRLARLSNRLRKFLKAPKEDSPSFKVRRFPESMFCDKCRRIVRWEIAKEKEGEEPLCDATGCGGKLVPMRFVVACSNGHLDDFPWNTWAHSEDRTGCRAINNLYFRVDQKVQTGGLASVRVECSVCGKGRSLEDLPKKDSISRVVKRCSGKHPWLHGRQACDGEVVALQRGATNLFYPNVVSAIDIPTDVVDSPAQAYAGQVKSHPRYQELLSIVATEAMSSNAVGWLCELIGMTAGCPPDVVMEIARADLEGRPIEGVSNSQPTQFSQEQLLQEEWRTIDEAARQGGLESRTFSAFVEPLYEDAPEWMRRLFAGVLLIRRLREVRAYLGFHRVKPSDPERLVRPDVGAEQNWLPAMEVFGEGIVLIFRFELLRDWIGHLPESVTSSMAKLEEKRLAENYWFLPQVDPITIALHTFSHLLLRRITFECGYSSSSLRERLYLNPASGYAGVMIYTADGDSEGSLGGLVRQGRQDRLAQSIAEAVEQGRWCSSDPVCSETAGQGLGGFNHAACHACCLVSETSCTLSNTMLDRRMLFDGEWGLLRYAETGL